MPGHIETSIPLNTRKVQSGNQSDAMDATQIAQARARIASDRQGTFRICRTKRFGRSTWLPLCFDRTLKCSLSRLKNSQFLPNRSNLLADIMQFIMGLFT